MSNNYRQLLNDIKFKMQVGIINYYEAKAEAEPIIAEMNTKGKEIAKKFGQRFKPFTFAYLIR